MSGRVAQLFTQTNARMCVLIPNRIESRRLNARRFVLIFELMARHPHVVHADPMKVHPH